MTHYSLFKSFVFLCLCAQYVHAQNLTPLGMPIVRKMSVDLVEPLSPLQHWNVSLNKEAKKMMPPTLQKIIPASVLNRVSIKNADAHEVALKFVELADEISRIRLDSSDSDKREALTSCYLGAYAAYRSITSASTILEKYQSDIFAVFYLLKAIDTSDLEGFSKKRLKIAYDLFTKATSNYKSKLTDNEFSLLREHEAFIVEKFVEYDFLNLKNKLDLSSYRF